MSPLDLCKFLVGMNVNHAAEKCRDEGCTSRITGDGSKIILENITSDFDENRINLRVERNLVKHARIG